jgi:hypothetical protein
MRFSGNDSTQHKQFARISVWGLVLILAAGLAVLCVWFSRNHSLKPVKPTVAEQSVPMVKESNPPVPVVVTNQVSVSIAATNDSALRPLPVAYESGKFQWTMQDGKDTNVIRQLAHNPLEYDRMVRENDLIFKRQLVYLKETPAMVFEQAKLTGQPVKQLTLPGVDGREFQFEITKSGNGSSSRQGDLTGRLAGNMDSMVTLAFTDGRMAFTVLSQRENIYVVGEPREDGQVVVKVVNPSAYGVGPADVDDSIKPATIKK